MELNTKNFKKMLWLILFAAVIFTALQNINGVMGLAGRFLSVFSPVIAALCVAFVLNVLLTTLETKLFGFMGRSRKKIVVKLRRPVCLFLTYLIALGIVSILMLVIIPEIIDTVTYIAEKMPSLVIQVKDWIEGLLHRFNIEQADLPDIKINWADTAKIITDWLSGYSKQFFGDAVNITTSVFNGVFDTLFSLVISVYVLAQKERIGGFVKRVLNAFIPEKGTKVIYHIASRTYECFARFIGGQLMESLILGVLCFIGMLIFGFPNALIISVLISVTSLVPIVGAFVGVVIGFLLIVISSPIKALLFVIFFIVLQQIEGNLIYPKVVGKAVGLPGVIVVSAVLVGGNIGGILGGLVAVPTSAVIFILIKEAVILRTKRKQVVLEENIAEG